MYTTGDSKAGKQASSRGFTPISVSKYVKMHVAANPKTNAAELTASLRRVLEAQCAGAVCRCGEPIWVIGSVHAGLGCLTCITGEAVPDHEYEVVAAS